MVDVRRIYQRLKGIRSSLKAEVSRIEEEIKQGDDGIQNVDEEKIKSSIEKKTMLRKEFDSITGRSSPYRKK